MLFTFNELPASREWSYNPPTFNLMYKAVGEQNDLIVQQYALNATPLTIYRPGGVLKRQDLKVVPDGWAQYVVTAPYARKQQATGSVSFSFDTTGATINIKAAKSHVATYNAGGVVAGDWHKSSINVKGDGEVEGVDIVIPALKMVYSLKHPEGVVTEAHARSLSAVTGRTNLNPWRGWQAGELLFAGATGADGTDSEAELGYQFVASTNETALTIGQIANIAKKGHDYAWIEFEDEVQSGEAVKRPKRVHIDRVYDALDFASFFGWS